MTQQDLHGPDITGSFVNHGNLSPAERMSSIFPGDQSHRLNPLIQKPGVLPCAQVSFGA
ncbi:hypothetical protein APA386B_1665 [Acetobacter pasteurianus 386B]|nr:hypothetical protein APA386B_1665 [Acetobacter pasteurianus 386B]